MSDISAFDENSLVLEAVPMAPPDLGRSNLFPKMPKRMGLAAWELWYFDGGTEDSKDNQDGQKVFTVSFFHDTRRLKEGGWAVQVYVLWADGAMWTEELYFSPPIVDVTADGRTGDTWKTSDDNWIGFQGRGGSLASATRFCCAWLRRGNAVLGRPGQQQQHQSTV